MLTNLMNRIGYSKITEQDLSNLREELFTSHVHDSVSTQTLDGFYSSKLGHGTSSDKAEMFDIHRERRRSRGELDALYSSSGLIQKIVNLVVNDATRRGIKILSDDSEMIKQQLEDLHIEESAKLAGRYARAFRQAFIFLDIEDGRNPDQPVDLKKIRTIRSATVYDSEYIRPFSFERWHNEPEYYMLTADETKRIHKDRLLVFNGVDAGMNNYINAGGLRESIIDLIYRPFRNLEVDYNAASTMAKDYRVPILKLSGFGSRGKGKTREDVAAAKARYKTMKSMLSVINGFVMGQEDSMEYLTQTVQGYADLVKLAKEYLCFVSGIPHSKLFNENASSGMNGGKGEAQEQDWVHIVEDYQGEHLKRPYQKILKYLAAYNKMEPFRFEFHSPFPLDPKTEAEIGKIKAETQKIQSETDGNNITNRIVTEAECRRERFMNNHGDDAERFVVEGDLPEAKPAPKEPIADALDDLADLLNSKNGLYLPL